MTHTRGRTNDTLPVYFTPRMVADSGGYSPSAAKPAKVVASWMRLGLPIEPLAPAPASIRQISAAHSRRYVKDVLAGRRENGFGNRSLRVAASLPFTSGAMLAAARHALETGTVAVAPVAGFHHAGYAHGAGFCTFNGLMVTACTLRAEGLVRRVGIIDCDMHEGDGTDDVIEAIGAQGWVRHFTAGARYHDPAQASIFLDRLPEIVESMADCDLVLYQAGADPHVDDPLGGFLTTDQLRERDAIVFGGLARLGLPVAWNLAGGYQREADGSIPVVLEIHANTVIACIEAFGIGSDGMCPTGTQD